MNIASGEGITNAGVLFFAKEPRRFILQAQMTLIAFKGTDRVHIFDRQDIQDDLLAQFNAAVLFLKKHLNRRSIIKGINREDIYEIPLEALREALVNSIIHRDYGMTGTSLMVEVYDDRVEITNPGGIPKGLHKKDFGRVSMRRNELIADLFHRMDKGERAGTGIRRMSETMDAAGLPLPEIRHETFYTIIFKRPFDKAEAGLGERLGESSVKILDAIRADRTISAKKMSEMIGISITAVEKQLAKLKQDGLLKRVGTARGGHWELCR